MSLQFAHAEKPVFGWNKAFTAGVGYLKLHSPFGTDSFGTTMPTDLVGLDVHIYGVYIGGGLMGKKTNYSVYGYEEKIETFLLKFGPSCRVYWEDKRCKLSISPFFMWGTYSVDDTSGNAIGQRQDYGNRGNVFGGGVKLTFAYKYFEIGVTGSNRDVGVGIGVNLDL